VIAVSTPNHPVRLLGLLAASAAFFAIVGAAAYAAMWMIDDQRSSPVSQVAGVSFTPDVQIPGAIVLQRMADAGEFEDLSGFKPFIPSALPEQTQDVPALSLTLPDENGKRVGRVGFSAKDGVTTDGISGPLVVLIEAPGTAGATVDGELKRITSGNGRTLAATLPCGDLVVDVQMYFGPDPADGEPFVKPYMTATAQSFVDAVRRECAER
jgi:hypothetical protein